MAARMPLRILLAEDNAINQQLALLVLESMGYRADVVSNGQEAIEQVAAHHYDVVLMDVQMPEMDGLQATRAICARWPQGKRPRIVAMTANAMHGDREACLAAGMDDYLSKPIRVDELAGALSRTPRRAISAPESQPEPASGLDPVAIDRLRSVAAAGGDGAFARLVDAFVEGAPALVAQLRESVADGRTEDAMRAAHTLKSNAATFGAARLAALAQEIEADARRGALADGSLAPLEAEFDSAREQVRALLED